MKSLKIDYYILLSDMTSEIVALPIDAFID